MESTLKKIRQAFEENVKSVYDLMNFDDIIQLFCLNALNRADKGLTKFNITNPAFSVKKEIDVISSIRSNKSLRPHYQIMLNQCVVLLVSYFASGVQDTFTEVLSSTLKQGCSDKLSKEEIKFSIGELQALQFNLSEDIGEVITAKKNISFQDMQSIARAFNDYVGFEPDKGKDVNNIILAQACRHVLVHYGGVTTNKTINQLSHATPRQIKENLQPDEKLSFTTDEIKTIGTSMTKYLDNLIQGVTKRL